MLVLVQLMHIFKARKSFSQKDLNSVDYYRICTNLCDREHCSEGPLHALEDAFRKSTEVQVQI